MGIIRIQDQSGDTEVKWDTKDKKSVVSAEKIFSDLMTKNHMAYKTDAKGSEIIKSFDPTADEIVVAVPLVGG